MDVPAENLEIEGRIINHTRTLLDGRVVYAMGNDHLIGAVRCTMLVRLVREQVNLNQVGEDRVSLLVPGLTDLVFV